MESENLESFYLTLLGGNLIMGTSTAKGAGKSTHNGRKIMEKGRMI